MENKTSLSNLGAVVSVRGSVVDIRFDQHLPPIYWVLRTGAESQIVIEVRARLHRGGRMRQPDGSSALLTTRLDAMLAWARKNSLWPLPFGTACCAIEFMSTVSSHYDLARFGAEVVRFSPRQSDMMIVAGTITDKMAPVVKRIYDQMAEPKYVVSMGACATGRRRWSWPVDTRV